ncbi:mechanosensitive ion channel [Ferruginibacter paludis]|uniref:mechanosensitive ion channel family protein n=1 Tax=Ferruginibacter paludis TaxID=1310417 RepID=UPI0025B5D6DF|nr:mechanosensitive ion channel domain-containing protein [Ferruginibacter paludis]MDN3655283.1 mechanosensitive ion channel [Ferruginibacter paludis]
MTILKEEVKKYNMLPAGKHNKLIHLFIGAMLLLGFQPAFSQQTAPVLDKQPISDSMLPTLVTKVATYTATIDHTDFLIRRKFNITPISLNMPEIERKIKGFKARLEKNGSHMNLRSLNSGVIMLTETSDDLSAYQSILSNYSRELTQSNTEVKKILRDPILNAEVNDSVIQEQLEDIRTEGRSLDSLQQKVINRVNLLRNKVSVNLLQATDIISDMRYLTISLKLGIWKQEEAPLFTATQQEYKNNLAEITGNALVRSGKIIMIYLGEKWDVITLGLLVFICIFSWTWLNMHRIKKQENKDLVLGPIHFLRRNVLIGCGMALFTYLPYFFANPPMSLLHALELFRLLLLAYLIYPYLAKQSKIIWLILCLLWLYYAMDDLLLESALGERWGLFFSGIIMAAVAIKITNPRQPHFSGIPESPATKTLAIFTLTQAVLSIFFNLAGRVTLAKIFGVSAIQCLMLGISLKVFCSMVMEAIYLQSEAYHDSRISAFIDFKTLQHRFVNILWILASTVWTISLARNLTLYDTVIQLCTHFFEATRTIGSMVFTFESVAIFIFIIWLSSVISGFISFFFGSEKLHTTGKRSRLGSMMLLIRLAIWILGFFIAVAAAGIPIDKLSIMIGALGVGIGFGLQNIVNNLVSGVILAFERPIQVGDLIEVGGKMGVVKEIGVRSSKINNNEGADIIVPNGDLLSQHLINWTMQDRNKQVEYTIGIPYNSDIEKVRGIIRETLAGEEKIMAAPVPSITVKQFGERTIDLKISFWVFDLSEAGAIRSNAMIKIYEKLTAAGIQLPVSPWPLAEQNVQPDTEAKNMD